MPPNTCATCGGLLDASGLCPQCATQVRSGSALPVGATPPPSIPGYTIERALGEGGMGAVYLAEETKLGRRVAIKVVSRRIAQDPQARSRFLREARTLATIEHPHVVRVYTFGEADESAYLVMEYVDGETLADRMARVGRLPLDDALRIVRQTVDALEAAWERKIVHRDIKPSNILLDRKGNVRVADFGLAKPLQLEGDSGLTQSGLMVGTPHYISPEQARGKEADFRSDIYSLGIVLYQMLTAERPYDGATPFAVVAQHLHSPLPSVRLKRHDIPLEVERLLERMTAKEPEQRPASHAEVAAALGPGTPPSPLPSVSLPIERGVARWWNPDLRNMTAKRRAITVAAVLGAVLLLIYAVSRLAPPGLARAKKAPRDDRFVVAVAPFYGPDDDSAKEGRVMAALIERAVMQRLGESARVLGIDATKTAVRDHKSARELGGRLPADVVIWGEAFALRTETEIQPHVTVVAPPAPAGEKKAQSENAAAAAALDEGGSTLRLEAAAPNQIELRKTSAAGIGDLAVMLAGVHALQRKNDPRGALALLEQGSPSPENLRYRAQALIALGRYEDALEVLRQSLAGGQADPSTQALIGDLLMFANRRPEALVAYGKAAASGKPYASTQGFVFDGKTWIRETYRSRRYGNHETAYLLALDASGHVVARRLLPGVPRRFSVEAGRVVIAYDADEHGLAEIALLRAGFDRPLWLPARLDTRMKSMKSGLLLAANFMDPFRATNLSREPVRLQPGVRLEDDAPKTLPELEAAVRRALERDPTQPWHRFVLAIVLRAQDRMAQADAAFEDLLRARYPDTPYYEWAWMAYYLERMHATAWADRLYPRVMAARNSLAQPVGTSQLFERIVNAQFSRAVDGKRDPRRGYLTLLRARAIGGLTFEGEDMAALIWRDYFRQRGDHAAAEREAATARQVQRNPFNMLTRMLGFEYALSGFAATLVAMVVIFVAVILKAMRRARYARERGVAPFHSRVARLWHEGIPSWRLSPPVTRVLVLAVVSGAIVVWLTMLLESAVGFLGFLLLMLLLPLIVVHAQRVRMTTVVACITGRERVVLAIAVLLLAGFAASVALTIDTLGRLAAFRISMGDSIGHASIVRDFERRLSSESAPELRYAAAVVNHYAGLTERARALYTTLGDDARAAKNAAALQQGKMPVEPLTSHDVARAYLGSSSLKRLAGMLHPRVLEYDPAPLVMTLALSFLIAVILLIPPRDDLAVDPPPHPIGLGRRAVMLLLPGLHDIHEGRMGRGFASIAALGVALPSVIALAAEPRAVLPRMPFFGGVPNLFRSFPLPIASYAEIHDVNALRLATPYAHLFYSVLIAAIITFVVLHVLTVRNVWSAASAARALTRPQPAR